MRGGYEPGFVRRRREVYAFLQHPMEEPFEPFLVALQYFGIARRRCSAKVDAEHASDRPGRERQSVLERRAGEAIAERARRPGEAIVETGGLKLFQGREPCSHPERVARER